MDISKYPGGEFLFSTWGIKNSSEESNETSEELFDAHVENKKYPRGDFRFSTWIFEKGGNRTNFPVKICKTSSRENHRNPELTPYEVFPYICTQGALGTGMYGYKERL